MPSIHLRDFEIEERLLPHVCMRCGEQATVEQLKSFAWHPPWLVITLLLGILPGAIIIPMMTKTMSVFVPLCAHHKNHWFIRNAIGVLGGAVVFGGTIAALYYLDQPETSHLMGYACMGGSLLFVIWACVIVVFQYDAIRTTEITESGITLTGVCTEFIDALDSYRKEERNRRRHRREADREPEMREPREGRTPNDDRIRGTMDEDEQYGD